MTAAGFARLAGQTLLQPEAAWQRLRALPFGPREHWLALLALTVVGTLAAWLTDALLGPVGPVPDDPPARMMEAVRLQLQHRPVVFAAMQLAGTVLLIALVTRIGRLFGGRAGFNDVLLAAVWMKAMLFVLQLGQLVLVHFAIGLAALLAMVETVLFLYLAVRLTQVVHGFRSPLLVAVGMAASFLALVFGASILLMLFGLTPQEF